MNFYIKYIPFYRCNSEKNVKIGERENRIYSSIVRSKYIGFGHGIGRLKIKI